MMYVSSQSRGFGAVDPTVQQVTGIAYSAGAGIATPAIAGTGTALGGALGAAAIPIVGAAFAGIFLGIQAILNSGCGQSCIVTSNWANQAEDLLKKNLAAYMALPMPRALSAQAAYVANFDAIWNYLVQECSNPQLGGAGKACISDRQAGSCKWRDSSGQCFNWFSGYRDPIANDPNVVPDSSAVSASISALTSSSVSLPGVGTVSGLALLALVAVLIVGAVAL
jgi:hypothetical protein